MAGGYINTFHTCWNVLTWPHLGPGPWSRNRIVASRGLLLTVYAVLSEAVFILYCFLIALIINIYRFIAYLFSKWVDIFRNDISESAEAIWHIYSVSYHVFSDKSIIETVSIVYLMKLYCSTLYQVCGPVLLLCAFYFYIWHRENGKISLFSNKIFCKTCRDVSLLTKVVRDSAFDSLSSALENLFLVMLSSHKSHFSRREMDKRRKSCRKLLDVLMLQLQIIFTVLWY